MIDYVNIFMFLALLFLLIERIPEEKAVTESSQILSNIEGQS
jgi:hypothetical protein